MTNTIVTVFGRAKQSRRGFRKIELIGGHLGVAKKMWREAAAPSCVEKI
jgi:hypothetical protein